MQNSDSNQKLYDQYLMPAFITQLKTIERQQPELAFSVHNVVYVFVNVFKERRTIQVTYRFEICESSKWLNNTQTKISSI